MRRASILSTLAVVLLAAACGSGATSTTHHAQPAASSGGRAPASSAVTTPAVPWRCTTSQLEVWIGVGAGGATAGSTYYPMEFTNISRHPCHLYGYPGVSAWDGHQDGSAAHRAPGAEPTVTLAPGATAHALLRVTDVGNFSPGSCRPVTASALRVYPPDEYTSTEIPFGVRACGRAGSVFLSISPIQPAIGVPGSPGA